MRLKGRHWFFLWLMLFLGTALAVATRQGKGLSTARRLRILQDRRIELEGKRTELLRRIGELTSRDVLVPRMEQAGMHLPSESENILITLDSLVAGAGRGR